jgi:hypothetical protein
VIFGYLDDEINDFMKGSPDNMDAADERTAIVPVKGESPAARGRGIKVVQISAEMSARIESLRSELQKMDGGKRKARLEQVHREEPDLYEAIQMMRSGRRTQFRQGLEDARAVREIGSQIETEMWQAVGDVFGAGGAEIDTKVRRLPRGGAAGRQGRSRPSHHPSDHPGAGHGTARHRRSA